MKQAVLVGGQAPAAGVAVTATRKGEVPAAAAPLVPFTRASMEHTEPFLDSSVAVGASPVVVSGGPVDVPAYGYLAHIVLFVTCTGGTGTVAVGKEDAPWSAIQDVQLLDVNGAPIVLLTGYDLMLANMFGGYSWASSPTANPAYGAMSTAGNFSFALRIPVQINRKDALGSLPNSNASSTYKLRITQAPSTGLYATPPTGAPTIRYRAFIEAWAQPPSIGVAGNANAVQPPALGTTQFWTSTQLGVSAGMARPRMARVGNLIRNLILVSRAASDGTRATGDALFPADFSMEWDSHLVFQASSDLARFYTYERFGYASPPGVRVLSFTHDLSGHAGEELRDLWIPTTQSSRLEIVGQWAGAANISVITNDVAPVGNVFL